MKRDEAIRKDVRVTSIFLMLVVAVLLTGSANVFAFMLEVKDNLGNPVDNYRYLVEEDTTTVTVPGALVSDSIAVDIHNSYNPVIREGMATSSQTEIVVDPLKRYFVSVLPMADASIGGAQVAPGQSIVRVNVNAYPLPTAQISILVFADHSPINNAWDDGEPGLAGFNIIIADKGGRQMMDAFGNMLGTTYQTDVNGNFLLDAEGMPKVEMPGNGIILSNDAGEAYIKYVAPGKYAVQVVPPAGQNWIQTSTIEGTKVIDAWVRHGEPETFIEGFGTGFKHASIGFVQPESLSWAQNPPAGGSTITGQLVYNHFSRPPFLQGYFPGEVVPDGWVGLNDPTASPQGLIAVACDSSGFFSIPNVPAGTYQLVTWDKPLDSLFGFNTVVVPEGGGAVDLGHVLAFSWFGRLKGQVFMDMNENGYPDPMEMGISGQAVNLRFRDGTVYQSTATDMMGKYELVEIFPFFKWLVTEVDFARFKATGATIAVDQGGEIPPANGWTTPSFGSLNPQPQAEININTGNNLSRTETGVVLTLASHMFLGQTNVIDWGKNLYADGENGGISGIVYYATTRAENDPRYAAAEGWEPGIPRVQVTLYQDVDLDTFIDDLDSNGIELADVDNFPFDWTESGIMGAEDVDRNYPGQTPGVFDAGDAVNITWTDSWDDSKPTGCIQDLPVVHGQEVNECYDNFGTWNQVRDGIFNGGYAFETYFVGGFDPGNPEVPLVGGYYIVQASPPPGYELVKEEDKNVDFGDSYLPHDKMLPPICVGDDHIVAAELTLFPGVEAPSAGLPRPLCDRKHVRVAQSLNTATDFFFFTPVPIASRAVGFVNNDLSAEFDTTSPVYGEKAAPAWIPISVQDFMGREISRIYSDEWGAYNVLIPSTVTANLPAPSGMSPHMATFCLNSPFMTDPNNPALKVPDPWFDPNFSQACWTLDFMPGTTTYLDTPTVPVAAFTSYRKKLDVEFPDGTPLISSLVSPLGVPYICEDGLITITAVGQKSVPNPDYDSTVPGSQPFITRDYGFGIQQGQVYLGKVLVTPKLVTWSPNQITINLPVSLLLREETNVYIRRADNLVRTPHSVVLHKGLCSDPISLVRNGESIQQAIDQASPCERIIVGPGVYEESLIITKPVRLFGSGAESTVVNGHPNPINFLSDWYARIQTLIAANEIPEPVAVRAKESPALYVIANPGVFDGSCQSGVDGFTFSGSLAGGGVYIDSNVHSFTVSNNRISSNQGVYGGGVTVGTKGSLSDNTSITVTGNVIVRNGGIVGGGGVSLYAGATDYVVSGNVIAGNFSRFSGGGILHFGLSDNGRINNNRIAFNEIFFGGAIGGDGGGIYIGSDVDNANPNLVSEGAGSVVVNANLIHGNLSGSGDGGGICAFKVNGADVVDNPATPDNWYSLKIFNNLIVNNVAAYRAGGIFLQDVAKSFIINNTVANNESTSTAANAFNPGEVDSTPHGAGIVAGEHSLELATASMQVFSDPALEDNIIFQNRSWHWKASLNGNAGGLSENYNAPGLYWDLDVETTTAQALNPMYSLLTSTAGYDASNFTGLPRFRSGYFNAQDTSAVIDEGGNFISVRFSPLSINSGDYHILRNSDAAGRGHGTYLFTFQELLRDYDTQLRRPRSIDVGADTYQRDITPALN